MHCITAYANTPDILQGEVHLVPFCASDQKIGSRDEWSPTKWQTWKMGHQYPSLGDFVDRVLMALSSEVP